MQSAFAARKQDISNATSKIDTSTDDESDVDEKQATIEHVPAKRKINSQDRSPRKRKRVQEKTKEGRYISVSVDNSGNQSREYSPSRPVLLTEESNSRYDIPYVCFTS